MGDAGHGKGGSMDVKLAELDTAMQRVMLMHRNKPGIPVTADDLAVTQPTSKSRNRCRTYRAVVKARPAVVSLFTLKARICVEECKGSQDSHCENCL